MNVILSDIRINDREPEFFGVFTSRTSLLVALAKKSAEYFENTDGEGEVCAVNVEEVEVQE